MLLFLAGGEDSYCLELLLNALPDPVLLPSLQPPVGRGVVSDGDSVEIEVEKRANLKELFGSAKFSVSAQRIKDEARAGWRE